MKEETVSVPPATTQLLDGYVTPHGDIERLRPKKVNECNWVCPLCPGERWFLMLFREMALVCAAKTQG